MRGVIGVPPRRHLAARRDDRRHQPRCPVASPGLRCQVLQLTRWPSTGRTFRFFAPGRSLPASSYPQGFGGNACSSRAPIGGTSGLCGTGAWPVWRLSARPSWSRPADSRTGSASVQPDQAFSRKDLASASGTLAPWPRARPVRRLALQTAQTRLPAGDFLRAFTLSRDANVTPAADRDS
jgi:hypothetical protein